MSLTVGICLTTHNRCADLSRTLAALARLAPAPDEIIVTADGCTDGTLDLLRRAHPEVRLLVHATARGSIPSPGSSAK